MSCLMKKRRAVTPVSSNLSSKIAKMDGGRFSTNTSKVSDTVIESFICPITHFLMVDPVLAEDGHIYEREAIQRWLSIKPISPLIPSKKITGKNLFPIRVIKEAIKALVESGSVEKFLSESWREKNRELMLAKGIILYKKGMVMDAAKLGYPKAQARVAYWYFNGRHGLKKDYSKCIELARKAAKAGDRLGQSILGYVYDLGYGVESDKKTAKYWYEKAANQGETTAMYNLARMYANEGCQLDQDYVHKAMNWYRKCADAGCKSAMLKMGKLLYKGVGLPKSHQMARDYFKKASRGGNKSESEATFLLGKMMIRGQGGPKDFGTGFCLIEDAASKGCVSAKKIIDAVSKLQLDD